MIASINSSRLNFLINGVFLSQYLTLNPDHISQILPAADRTLKGLNIYIARVYVLFNDGPFGVAARRHLVNDPIQFDRAVTEFAEHTASHRLKEADFIPARGL